MKGRFEHNVDVTVGEDGEVAMHPLKSSPGVSPTSVELRKEAIWEDCWPNLQEGLNLGCSLYFEGPKTKKTKEQALRSFNEPLDLRTCLNSDNRDHLVGQLPQLWEPMFTHSSAVDWPWKNLTIFDKTAPAIRFVDADWPWKVFPCKDCFYHIVWDMLQFWIGIFWNVYYERSVPYKNANRITIFAKNENLALWR